MPCYRFGGKMPDGTPYGGFVCTRNHRSKPCSVCGRPMSRLCDYRLRGAKAGKTCDRPLCERCAVRVGPDRDLCPAHAREVDAKNAAHIACTDNATPAIERIQGVLAIACDAATRENTKP